jgi:hypothetical protein
MRAPKQGILYQEKLIAPKAYVRFSTPADAAKYRAERLKCNCIAEIGAGIGGQTIALAETCKKVIAVESNAEMFEILKKNLEILNIKNVEPILGDALSAPVIDKIKKAKPEIVFCDTERPEKGKRSIEDLKPDIWKLIEKYSDITDKIALEVPPFTNDLNRLKESYEKEFISSFGELNRLTLYFNKLKKSERSVVSLPSKAKLEYRGEIKKAELADTASIFSYLYTIDPAIPIAELMSELASELKYKAQIIEQNKKVYLVSKEKLESSFIVAYKILDVTENNFEAILASLKKLDAKSVVIRYSIPPLEYWNERKRYESKLSGKRKIHLFANNEAILCESLSY